MMIIKLEMYYYFSPEFEADVARVWNFENSVEQYQSVGGTSSNSVKQQIKLLKTWIENANNIVL